MSEPKIETRQCRSCKRIHPPPWDDRCPSNIAATEEGKEIIEFVPKLTDALYKCKNSSQLIAGIKKLINIKGISKDE